MRLLISHEAASVGDLLSFRGRVLSRTRLDGARGSPPCSLSVISGWRDGVFFIPWRGVPTIPARRISTGSGRRLAASPVLFREIAVFYKETAIGIGVSSAAKPRSAKRLSKRFVCCCFERRLK